MSESQTADVTKQLYDVLVEDYLDHRPHTRPVHVTGIGAEGYFVPSPVAAELSSAAHFTLARVPTTVRFSNGSGSPQEPDSALDVRGMATKFHLPGGVETDLIMITLPVFFAADPAQFLGFSLAGLPKPVKNESWWGRLMDRLRLRVSLPDPGTKESGTAGVLAYANRHMAARPGTVAAMMLVAPTSYARCEYHALHTFKLTDASGKSRYCRFTWEPVAGVRPLEDTHVPDHYLQAELRERLGRGPVRFVLRAVFAGQGDDLADPTKVWDTTRERVVLGELFLVQMVADQVRDCDRLSFNPTRLVPGVECSEDPILAARRDVYQYSCGLRGGHGCLLGGG